MASITITGRNIVGNILTVYYTTDCILTNVQLTRDGVNFIDSTSFNQNGAIFNLSGLADGSYTDYYIQATYLENPVYGNITLNKTKLTIQEGGTGQFGVKLSVSPTIPQKVTVTVSNTSVFLNKTELTFDSINYNSYQYVTVGVLDPAPSYLAGAVVVTLSSENVSDVTLPLTLTDNSKSVISTVKFGIVEGLTADATTNTTNFQAMIDYCKNSKTIEFPAGDYVFNPVDLGEGNNITIKGVASSFASVANKNIYTGSISDTFTRIICNVNDTQTFFTHKSCVLVLENVGFYNFKKSGTTFSEEEAKTNTLMQHTKSSSAENNTEKGKVFALNCAFFGWKVAFGCNYTIASLETALGTGLSAPSYIKQSCVVASRCRFTRNAVAINENVDGRLVDCSFNKNDYAMLFQSTSGFTTVNACRIEWNNYNGIYANGAHEINVNACEFDCNGYAGLYVINNTNSNFNNNTFRRNGAAIATATDNSHRDDYVNNLHIYATGNTNCNFIGSVTRSMVNSDTGSGSERPTNCTYFASNTYCNIVDNNLAGCTKSDKNDANKFENNTTCRIDNMLNL